MVETITSIDGGCDVVVASALRPGATVWWRARLPQVLKRRRFVVVPCLISHARSSRLYLRLSGCSGPCAATGLQKYGEQLFDEQGSCTMDSFAELRRMKIVFGENPSICGMT